MVIKRLLGRLSFVLPAVSLAWTIPVQGGLDEYVKKPDPAYSWKYQETTTVPGAKIHRLNLTSQIWQGITWTHIISLIEPTDNAYPDAMLLFITGGKIGDGPRNGDIAVGLACAKTCRARVVVLPQAPNQPLLGGKTEDTLIAETFVRYLETKDEEWPLLFPMVKSAVRAMDAAQAFAKERKAPVERFVVTGASKRGWTTWLTGAVDPRVKAIAPMVIPTLNFRAQNKHQLENFGKYSDQIDDYTARGLMDKLETPEGTRLWHLVDPLTFRDRLTMPKLQINGTNDPYWTLDSMNLFWDDLKGPKTVVYLPNAGHGLDQHREYATQGIGAIFRSAIGGKALPELSWKHGDADTGALQLSVTSSPVPKSAQLWTATSDSLDFRKSKWSAIPLKAGPAMAGEVARPATGNVALFADLEYETDGLTYHLSTQVRQTNVKSAP
jgi:PhoPQ-activated pathogenicity-related protein